MATLSYDNIIDRSLSSAPEEQKAAPEEAARAQDRTSIRPMPLSSGRTGTSEVAALRGGLVQSDPRPKSGDLDKLSSYRIQIWRAAFQAIAMEPSVLWRGQLCDDVMTLTQSITGRYDIPGICKTRCFRF